MNYKRFKKYIVVDENYCPMSYDRNQFVYCNTEQNRRPFPVKIYTLKQAKELIKKTCEWRAKQGFLMGNYYLMPIKIN